MLGGFQLGYGGGLTVVSKRQGMLEPFWLLGRKVAHFLTILSGYDPKRGVYTTMMFSLCLSCDEINVALDPVTSRVVHVRLRVIDHIYVSACLPSY